MYQTGPFNSHFPLILLVTLASTVRSFPFISDKHLWSITVGTQAICAANLVVQNVLIQTLCHDVFAYVMVNCLLHTQCILMRKMGIVLSITQLSTRVAYNRCIFLWWNESRNVFFDVCVLLLTIVGARRTKPLVPMSTCIVVAIMTHFADDTHRLDPIRPLWKLFRGFWLV